MMHDKKKKKRFFEFPNVKQRSFVLVLNFCGEKENQTLRGEWEPWERNVDNERATHAESGKGGNRVSDDAMDVIWISVLNK